MKIEELKATLDTPKEFKLLPPAGGSLSITYPISPSSGGQRHTILLQDEESGQVSRAYMRHDGHLGVVEDF